MKIMIFLVARLVEFLQCLLLNKNACMLLGLVVLPADFFLWVVVNRILFLFGFGWNYRQKYVSVSAFWLSSLSVIQPKHLFQPKEAVLAKMTVSAKGGCLINYWFSISLPLSNMFLLCWYCSRSIWVQKSDGQRINWLAETVVRPKQCIWAEINVSATALAFLRRSFWFWPVSVHHCLWGRFSKGFSDHVTKWYQNL